MSKSSAAKSNPTDASQQASSQALLDELRLAADRARDERLKLARLVKHSGDLPVGTDSISSASSVSDSRLAALASQIERLEQAVTDKLVSLNTAQREINSRTQYLESLRHTITDTTQAFMTQVEEAQQFKTHVDAAKQHVRVSAGRIVEEVRQQISGMDGPISERIGQLKDLDKQIDKRISRMQQMHKQANEAVDQHLLASLRNAKEQAAELAEPLKKELDEYANVQRAKLEDAMHQKINDLDVDIEEALTPLTERFDEIVNSAQQRIEQLGSEIDPLKQRVDKLVEDTKSRIGEAAKGLDPLAERIEQIVEEGQSKADLFAETIPDRLETEMETQLDSLRGRLTDKAKAIVDGVDDQAMEQAGQLIHERIAKELDGYLNEAQEHAGGYVDGLIAKLDEARDKAIEAYDRSIQKIDHVNTVEREQAMARLDDEVKRTQAMSDERIQQAQQIVEQATDGIYARAATAVDSALKAAGSKIDQFETNAADHLRLIDDKIEHEMEASRKRLVAFDKAALRQADDAVRMADDGIAEAQKRIAGFESGVTQRVSLAVRTADDARASIDERLTKAETEASRRIMQMVDLAETSGSAVVDSINELAASAETTAAQAQQNLDEKLRSFEHTSAEALRTAEEVLRTHISDLRDSSRAMIEMVGRQVRAQAGDIEPQTREVVAQAEQVMRRRIGELRDAAQGMVDIAVSRLESQIDEVKVKAQQTAFEGIDGIEGIEGGQGNEAA